MSTNEKHSSSQNDFETENQEWLNSFRWILKNETGDRAKKLLEILQDEARKQGITTSYHITTPYCNTIPATEEVAYPGSLEIENNLI